MNDKFLPEMARRLKQEGIDTGTVENGRLPVLLAGREVMAVTPDGAIFLRPETANNQTVIRTYNAVAGISAQVSEYTGAMASASVQLPDGFRLLTEFNGVVLAGQELKQDQGYKFVTWRRDRDGVGVNHGNYYHNDYAGAKHDFACRSGLVQESRQFTDAQLAELYRCIHETLDSNYPITKGRELVLTMTAAQIERSVDDLAERVEQSNQRELKESEPEMDSGPRWEMSL